MMHRQRIFPALTQYTALALLLAMPAYAQDLPTEQFWQDEARHQELKGATITAQTLARTHQAVISRLGKLTYTADDAGNSVMPPLLSHLLTNSSIEGYTGTDAPYLPTAARDWAIRHRVCPDPDNPETYVVLTWIDQAQFRRGFNARQLQAAPRAYYENIDGRFDLDSQIGILVPLVPAGGTVRYSYEPFTGQASALPDCAIGSASGEWADRSGLPGLEVPALLTTLPLPNLALRWQSRTEARGGICPPAGAPERTISDDGKVRETRERRKLVDSAGRPVLMADGNPVPDQLTPWTYDSGCRAPRRQTVTLVQNCTYRTMGVDLEGQRIYLVDTYEAVPPAPYTEPAGLGQESWLILPGTTPRLISDGCTGDGTLPTIATTTTPTVITEPLNCAAVYAPVVHTHIPYSLGGIARQRTRTTYTTTFPADSGLAPIIADSYTPWAWANDTCHRVYSQSTVETGSVGCPAGYSGSVTQQRTRTDTTTDYANPGWADSVSTSYSAWSTTSNGCSMIWYSGGGGSGGGGGGSYIDVDGDGRGDFATASEAARAGFTGNNGIAGNYNRVSTYDRSSGVQSQVNHSRSSGGGSNNGGGGGGRSGRVICTELWRQGRVSRELAVMDLRFTAERLSAAHYRGYHAWAIPVVKQMRKSQRWTDVWHFIAVHRMNEIAWQLGKAERPDYIGKLVRWTLEPVSWLIGQFVGDSTAELAILDRTAPGTGPAPGTGSPEA